jgi:Uncharacterized protein conserved in bacteria (DUF2314)
MLNFVLSWPAFVVALIVFGFAPGAVLRLVVLAFPRDDPRRYELLAELHAVPRMERPFWVLEQFEVALFEGIGGRIQWAATGRIIWRWHLGNGVERNRLYPDTFEIPSEATRRSIGPGDCVKLMFEMRTGPGERMWVDVVKVGRRNLAGTLRNTPAFIPRLEPGDKIKFRREHIIGIAWPDDDLLDAMPSMPDDGAAS